MYVLNIAVRTIQKFTLSILGPLHQLAFKIWENWPNFELAEIYSKCTQMYQKYYEMYAGNSPNNSIFM